MIMAVGDVTDDVRPPSERWNFFGDENKLVLSHADSSRDILDEVGYGYDLSGVVVS